MLHATPGRPDEIQALKRFSIALPDIDPQAKHGRWDLRGLSKLSDKYFVAALGDILHVYSVQPFHVIHRLKHPTMEFLYRVYIHEDILVASTRMFIDTICIWNILIFSSGRELRPSVCPDQIIQI